MRRLLILGWAAAMGCGQSTETKKNFMEGTFVREFATEFAKGSDTLILREQGDNKYTIEKRSGFRRLLNGVPREKEYRQELWAGAYNPEEGVIHEFKKGKVVHFNPKENKLFLGASEYTKIN